MGQKKAISNEDLEEVIEQIEAGELIDREDVRREMLPNVLARTVRDAAHAMAVRCYIDALLQVCDSLAKAGMPRHVQRVKPNLQPHHIMQCEQCTPNSRCGSIPRFSHRES